MTIREALKSNSFDKEILLAHILKRDKAWLFANPDHKLSNSQLTTYYLLLRRRLRGVPIAYLTGHKEFYGLDFQITPEVLIPRPETELLVERALEILKAKSHNLKAVVDVGTGSGCIIVSLASSLRGYSRSNLKFYATDISKSALKIAKQNAKAHGVAKKIKFLKSNLLSNLQLTTYYSPTLILANLPYGWKQWKNNTSVETAGLKFEPRQALFTKEQGLYHIRRLLEQIKNMDSRLRGNDITVLIEHDPRQKQKLSRLAKKYFRNSKITFRRDLAGKLRVLELNLQKIQR